MEWHSDGAKGEATILLGLQNVSPDQGSLRVVPGSHMRYVEGIGHDEVSYMNMVWISFLPQLNYLQSILKKDDKLLEQTKLKYAYRAGKPIIIDARTLHSVDSNVSNDWRIVNWFIFDSY
jgi:2-keto-3-deoxy-galactonokinase